MKNFKALSKFIACALVLCLCAAFVPVMTFAEPASTPSVYDGGAAQAMRVDETNDKILYIDNAAMLKDFADQVTAKNQYKGYTIKLNCDVVWNSGNAADWATTPPANVWKADPTYGRGFQGTFDGQGHTISGLYGSGLAASFISYTAGATIKNLAIVNSYFTGTERIAAFVGQHHQNPLVIENVYSDAILVATTAAAGIVGNIRTPMTCDLTIKNAVFTGSVTAPKAAGIVMNSSAYESVNLDVSNALFAGSVTSDNAAGGIYYGPSSYVDPSNADAFVAVRSVTKNIVMGTVAGNKALTNDASDPAFYADAGNIYANTLTAPAGNTAMALADIQNISDDALAQAGFTGWVAAEFKGQKMPLPLAVVAMMGATTATPITADATINATVTLNGQAQADKTVALYLGTEKVAEKVSNAEGKVSFTLNDLTAGVHTYTLKQLNVTDGNGYAYDYSVKTVTITVSAVDVATIEGNDATFANVYVPVPNGDLWDGVTVSTSLEQDADGAYLIQSAADLALLQKQIQELGSTANGLAGTVYKLTTNIVWNTGSAADWATTAPANKWSTLSTTITSAYNARFAGTIDGQGHVIYGLYVNNDDAAAFISYGGDGVCIKNLAIMNSYFAGPKRTSAFLGAARNGKATLTNLYTDAIIDCAGSGAAGMVGSVNNVDGVEVTVEGCVFNGQVSSNGNTAGIVSESAGTKPKVIISNCVNLGTVTGIGDSVGGIFSGKAGASISIKNCINRGTVTGPDGKAVGALIAVYDGEVTCTDNIFDSAVQGAHTLPTDVTLNATNVGKTASEIAALTVDTLPSGFTKADWAMGKFDEVNYVLPGYVATNFAIANPGSVTQQPSNPNPPTSDVNVALYVVVATVLPMVALAFVVYRRKNGANA